MCRLETLCFRSQKRTEAPHRVKVSFGFVYGSCVTSKVFTVLKDQGCRVSSFVHLILFESGIIGLLRDACFYYVAIIIRVSTELLVSS